MMSVRRWPADRSRVAASIPVQSLPQLRLVLLDAPGAWLTRCASASLKRPSFVMNGEEMGQSDLSRRIAWRLRISGFGDPEPFCRLAGRLNEGRYRSASRDLQCGVPLAGHDEEVPGRYHGDAMEHRINHSPVKDPRVVAGSMSRARLSVRPAAQPSNPSAADY